MEKEKKEKSGSKNKEIKVRNENLFLLGGLHRQIRLKNLKDDLKNIQIETDKKIEIQPKEFEFYCQSCLYQTNEHKKICPKCNEGRLLKSK